MPAELFRSVVVRRSASRRRFGALPLSVAFHAALLVAVVTMPLLAVTDELPVPPIRLPALIVGMPVTVVPTVPPPPSSARPRPFIGPPPVPVNAPTGITPEIAREPTPPMIPDVPIGTLIGTNITDIPREFEAAPPPPPKPREPVRPGGDILPPRKIHNAAPVYPPIAIATRVQGTVEIEAIISTTGAVENVRVVRSVPLLDDAALAAVRQWVFTPTRLNGIAVPVIMTVKVEFKLQ